MLRKGFGVLTNSMGLQITRVGEPPPDADTLAAEIINQVKPYTMTSPERIYSLIRAVRHVVAANIPGAIVETGVWRGGSMMAVAHTLLQCGEQTRELYLFDTFEGMPKPTDDDKGRDGHPAIAKFKRTKRGEDSSAWCFAELEEVRAALQRTTYDPARIHFVKGKVQDTIPEGAPDRIALLRLDTDWYESSRHELEHLYPRLATGGVLILDDYGFWHGVKKATDEYFARHGIHILLNRIDRAGYIGIKP